MVSKLEDAAVSPLVDRLVATLTEGIRAGRYADGEGFPSERELVIQFGVSRTIVRRVLETLEQQSLLLRSPRCRTIVRPPGDAGSLRHDVRRRSVGLWLWSYPADPATSYVAQGICRTLDQNTYRLVIGNVVWDSWEALCRLEAQFLEHMAEDADISGVLLWCQGGQEILPQLMKLRERKIPTVFLDRLPPAGFECDYVGVDNEHAAEQIVRHLLTQGHRHIAHITNGDHASTVGERMNGYRRALEQVGIAFRPELVVKALEPSTAAAPQMHNALAEQLFTLQDPPTAVFAVNDVIAHRFMAALRRRGLRIPDDIAVAGFDGSERFTAAEPFLTTIEQPFELIGRRAARLLLQRIAADMTGTHQHLLLEAPLSIHGSTLFERRDSNTARQAL
jgi:LacI family transcriptional regulator